MYSNLLEEGAEGSARQLRLPGLGPLLDAPPEIQLHRDIWSDTVADPSGTFPGSDLREKTETDFRDETGSDFREKTDQDPDPDPTLEKW